MYTVLYKNDAIPILTWLFYSGHPTITGYLIITLKEQSQNCYDLWFFFQALNIASWLKILSHLEFDFKFAVSVSRGEGLEGRGERERERDHIHSANCSFVR
jgi:hypothetical protein